ncbi:unnamed protein product [Rangifer tarandus platyrhynchus]|uniref:Uncharacterized protein n=1 Tax=Rangifer tarandus platyrhynchus TaxID=3082113 RepID=A0ACB1MJG0_RANTA
MAPIVKFPRASCWEHNTPLYIFEGFPFREKTGKCIVRKMLLRGYFCVFINKAYVGLPGSSDGKEPASNAADPQFDPRVGKIPWRREWLSIPVFLPGESHGQRSLVGYCPWSQSLKQN